MNHTNSSTGASALRLVALTTVLAACGGAPGTRPHDSSARVHDESAVGEEQASTREPPCGTTSTASRSIDVPCWTALDPGEVARHRDAAAAHRAAAQSLRDAEARACVGIDDEDRDMSPFAHRADIVSVTPLQDAVAGGPDSAPRVVGARIVFRATPGLSAQWLQRVVDCHLARNAALGHDVPEMPYCPLVPRGASAQVTPLGDGFAVDVRGDGPASVQQVVDRADHLLGT